MSVTRWERPERHKKEKEKHFLIFMFLSYFIKNVNVQESEVLKSEWGEKFKMCIQELK